MNDYEIASLMDWPEAALDDSSPGSLLDRVRAVVAAAEAGERERQRAEIERLQADDLDHRAAFGEIYSALRPAYPLRSTWPAEIERLRADAANLRTVMVAAAEEIAAHWDAHCDAEGYGPTNLQHRLEAGIPSEYGYTAGAFATLKAERDAMEADAARYRWLTHDDERIGERLRGTLDTWDGCDGKAGFDSAIDAAMRDAPNVRAKRRRRRSA